MEAGVAHIPDPTLTENTAQLEICAEAITSILKLAIENAGRPNRDNGRAAPWWTDECKAAFRAHIQSRTANQQTTITEETRNFKAIVRKAKKAYWRQVIDEVSDDRALFKLIAWHKMTPDNGDSPLRIGDRTITDGLEKAEALREAVLHRFSAEDDIPQSLPSDIRDYTHTHCPTLPWNTYVSIEEVERNTIGVSSTSPGPDRVTVELLRLCWAQIQDTIQKIFQRCLELSYFPRIWKLAEVTMIPKVGKKDRTSPRSWRPIALLSCLGKGLERTVARRIAWTAMSHKILSPQQGGALPKRSAADLTAAFTHDVEAAWARGKHVSLITMDVQGAFDALLKNRLIQRMAKQGWPAQTLYFVDSFLTERNIQVRLGEETTPSYQTECGTPQGSPLSSILYTLYLAELLNADTKHRFGYADDISIYRGTHSLDENTEQLAEDVRLIKEWGDANKIAFAPEKLEMIHLTRQRGQHNPPCTVNEDLTIDPVPPGGSSNQPALRWLGVWFDRKLTFRRHVATRAAKAMKVAYHIRDLARTTYGPPASSLRKATIACVLPSLLYGTECWYGGRKRPPRTFHSRQGNEVSARVGWHIAAIDKIITTAARGVLPVWRTTPSATLYRDAGLPSALCALEEAKMRFATHLRTIDKEHPLARRAEVPLIRGEGELGANSDLEPKYKN